MIGREDQKIVIDKFRGLYNRGSVDEVPIDHAQDLLNTSSTSDSRVQTRSGVSKSFNAGFGVRRMFLMESLPSNVSQPPEGDPSATDGTDLLLLDNSFNLYIGDDPTPVYSVDGMSDFVALNMGNRTYASPSTGITGFRLGRLQVINSQTGSCRDAAGLAPTQSASFLAAAESATVGTVFAGDHKIAVIYETDTGFWTPPGPKVQIVCTPVASVDADSPTVITLTDHGMETGESHLIASATGDWGIIDDVWHISKVDNDHFSIPVNTFGLGSPTGTITVDGRFAPAVVTCVGGFKLDISNIPTGPSFIKKRLILATQAGGDEFFFVPNVPGCVSEIIDNTTTTTTIDFADSDLVDSADYLFDILEVIPGGGGMTKYRQRMVIAGAFFPGDQERVILSNVNDPETFNFVKGTIEVQTERDDNSVTAVSILRDTLYLHKFTGTFSTEDNGGDPSTWAVSVVDSIIGTYAYGLSVFTASQPSADTGDVLFIAHKSGLYLFDGVFHRPELTWKINDFWNRINFDAFFRVTVAHDPWQKLIYISAPLDSSTEPNVLLVMDYSAGRDPDSVRWHIWQFQFNPTCIMMAFYSTAIDTPGKYALRFGSIDSSAEYIWRLDSTATNDDGTKIVSYYVPGPLTFGLGGINFFKLLNFRSWGAGNLNLILTKEDGQGAVTLTALTLSGTPGRELQRQINFANEKMTLKFSSGTNIDDNMSVDRVDVWGLMMWSLRPSV